MDRAILMLNRTVNYANFQYTYASGWAQPTAFYRKLNASIKGRPVISAKMLQVNLIIIT